MPPFVFLARRFFVAASIGFFAVLMTAAGSAQPLANPKHSDPTDKFFQLDHWLATPTDVRTASGDAGPQYWQQRADYKIDITLDDRNQSLSGALRMRYKNQSPHDLSYIWMQLDQNHFRQDSETISSGRSPSLDSKLAFDTLRSILQRQTFEGGFELHRVCDSNGEDLRFVVNRTMMRIDLDQPLRPGQWFEVNIDYGFNIVDATKIRARGGYEFFEKDKNYIYEIAQWYPRVVAYTDYQGWQHKQFLGRGEFTLEIGDYEVSITTPADMVVAATGVLQNADECLTAVQRERLAQAATAPSPMYIVTDAEAKANQEADGDYSQTKTWQFVAKDVRDFAFAASRKFAWDAMGVKVGDQTVMAMSYFPIEGNPLWHQYSTEAIAHTLEIYSRYTFDYPYPVAISVNGPVYGMEYPMICFNGPRPEDDGTYDRKTKYGLISVIIHEVGHNYFPMIVNSDERKWTWMDEGLNTFMQFVAEQEWEEDYPSRRGDPAKIADYMRGGNQRPIMTGSEEILQFGNNAYAKPATALNILRETIMGRELFDFAFAEFARRWKFKRPTPADFFRTMEDASGMDLDWFWRGWFYSTDHVDIAISEVELFAIDQGDPDTTAERSRKKRESQTPTITKQRNVDMQRRIETKPELKDFYNSSQYDPDAVVPESREKYEAFLDSLDPDERSMLRRTSHFYRVTFANKGGLVMPIIARIHFVDGASVIERIPAEIWRSDSRQVEKLFIYEKEIERIELDPFAETADTNVENNHWPPKLTPSRFKLFKEEEKPNQMQRVRDEQKSDTASPQ